MPERSITKLRRALAEVYARKVDRLIQRRTLPDVLILGAQKAGTTSVFHALSQHPSAVPSKTKEVHFFDINYWKGLDWYRYHFPAAELGENKVRFESSPYYLFHPAVPERVGEHLPEARFIVLLRDPVTRAYSHYFHERSRGREALSFAEAVYYEPERLGDAEYRLANGEINYHPGHHRHAYLRRGDYVKQLKRWFNVFPRQRFLILESEALFEAPAQSLADITDFLGLDRFEETLLERRNKGAYHNTLDPDLARRLADRFAVTNRDLPLLTGKRFRWQTD